MDEITRCEREAGVTFPDDLKAFLGHSDGWNGEVGLGYLRIWGTDELAAGITGYELGDDLAGMFLIGSNAGPTAYGVDWTGGAASYVSVPFASTDRAEVRMLGRGIAEFVAATAMGEGW